MHSISVITATFNSENCLPNLIMSLINQTDKNFTWIVSDGGSNDSTLEIVRSVVGIDVVLLSSKDFGIYDALNKAIEVCDSDYYVVAGSDDVFKLDAIAVYRESLCTTPDIVAAWVEKNGKLMTPKHNKPASLVSQKKYIAAHSVGTLIKTELHKRVGLYSKKYPIAADQLFIMKACFVENVDVAECRRVVGVFGTSGVSSTDLVGSITEFYRVQLDVGMNRFTQLCIMIYKILFIAYRQKN